MSMKLAGPLRPKYSSAMLRPPVMAKALSATNSLLCMRRLMRENSCSEKHHARGDAAVAHRQRVEHAHLDVRAGGQAGQHRVLADGVQVVDQQAHAHAARGGVGQLAQELPAGGVVGDLVVLGVDALLGGAGQGDAGFERLLAGRQQAQARQRLVALRHGGGGDGGQAGVGHVGAGLGERCAAPRSAGRRSPPAPRQASTKATIASRRPIQGAIRRGLRAKEAVIAGSIGLVRPVKTMRTGHVANLGKEPLRHE